MPVTKKTFVGGVNQDDADFLLQPTEYLGALNIRFVTSESGEVGRITNIEGNVEKNQTINSAGNTVSWSLPAGTNRTIGAYEDTEKRRLIWFNWNSTGKHGIYAYSADADRIYTVLRSDVLDFQSDKFVHSVAMVDDLLYWTDNYNEPRRINVDAAIKMNHPTYVASSALIPFSVKITTAGSGYVNGTYNNVPLTGGSGVQATATIVVSGGTVTSAVIVYGGINYALNDTLSASNTNLGGSGSGLVLTINRILDKSNITLIRNQPWAPLTVNKSQTVALTNNFISDDAFQFCYRFVYRDNEVSTFSPLSKLIDYNTEAENTSGFNTVDVTLPLSQAIELDVKKVEFAVKYMTGGAVVVFKTIEDVATFRAHNNGTAITFKFFNDTIGVSVDNAAAVKPFDSVPLKVKTLDLAKSRLFLGNVTDGYDTPRTTSLSIGSAIADTTAIKGQWHIVVYRDGGITYTRYMLLINNITAPGYYDTTPIPTTTTPLPTTVVFSGLTFAGGGLSTIAIYLGVNDTDILQLAYQNVDATITPAGGQPVSTTLTGLSIFKSDSFYRAGVVFYDAAGRKSGVVTADTLRVNIPDRDYTGTSFYTGVNWSLNNISAVSEIPSWATHYSVVRTKCLTVSSFLQMRADSVHYMPKKKDDGTYDTLKHTYAADDFGLAINVKSLFSYGLGYSFNPGDILKLYVSGGSIYRLKIKDTFSNYVITDLVNLGNTSSTQALYEIYTPYVQSTSEFFYEVGQGRAGNRSVPQETGVFRLQFGEAMEQLHFGESLVEDHDPVELLARGFADRTADVVLDTLEGAFPNLLRLGVNLLRREEEILFRHLGEAGEFAGVLQDLGDDAFHRVLELDDDDRVLRNQRKTRIVSRDVDRRQGLVADDAQFQELVTGVTRDAHVLGQNQLALARARRLEDVEGGEFLGIGFRRFLETVPTLRQNLRGLLQPRVVDLDDFEDTVAVHAPAVRHHALVQLGFLRGIRFPRETSLVEIAMMEDFADLDVRAV